ncbi:MAG: hypothetical protein K2X93_20415 [Candidatus Obscuribacterales bacterium]|nr:hypothetical protein [Candidatus Obscuribacterales bacterium]
MDKLSKVVYSDRHLTPTGWIKGTERWEDGTLTVVEPPLNTAMTVRYSVPLRRAPYITTQWKTDKPDQLSDLISKFGDLPQDLKELEQSAEKG